MKRNEMVDQLRIAPVKVTFTKVNDEVRVMTCTLDSTLIPAEMSPKGVDDRAENEAVLAVYDVLAEGWRSFRVANVTEFVPLT
jgi:hypothetical protein|tara:strand:+ start:162 stop:410 length:249 start_codon:yes stop_codon:yes gene_type:complete